MTFAESITRGNIKLSQRASRVEGFLKLLQKRNMKPSVRFALLTLAIMRLVRDSRRKSPSHARCRWTTEDNSVTARIRRKICISRDSHHVAPGRVDSLTAAHFGVDRNHRRFSLSLSSHNYDSLFEKIFWANLIHNFIYHWIHYRISIVLSQFILYAYASYGFIDLFPDRSIRLRNSRL